jgi:predicted GIY-YIG superfamily endonuclease
MKKSIDRSHYVYILELDKNCRGYYIGYTSNIAQRLEQHTLGKGAQITRIFGVKRFVAKLKCRNQEDALLFEHELMLAFRLQGVTYGGRKCTGAY